MVEVSNTGPETNNGESNTQGPTTQTNEGWIKLILNGDFDAGKSAFIEQEIKQIIKKYGLDHYCVLLLHDEDGKITSYDANQLYAEVSKNKKDHILLVLHSNGGEIEPAYLIGKSTKRLCRGKFVVAVPRKAKSAATLISLGADEIHMGQISQLGPIDPQIGGLPVLALGDALDSLAATVCKHPGSADMIAKYLELSVPVRTLGYYKRVGESAVQYAERLLGEKPMPNGKSKSLVAEQLVNHYKDHGFVIDVDEARLLLGEMI